MKNSVLILMFYVFPLMASPQVQAEVKPCPRFAAPICPKGQVIVSRPHESIPDCSRPFCQTCPTRPAPLCKAPEILVTNQDSLGCPKPECMQPQPEGAAL